MGGVGEQFRRDFKSPAAGTHGMGNNEFITRHKLTNVRPSQKAGSLRLPSLRGRRT